MAMVPNRPAALVRRVTTYSLVTDVIVSVLVGVLISSTIGWIVFVIGLLITGFIYFNFRSVMRARGMR